MWFRPCRSSWAIFCVNNVRVSIGVYNLCFNMFSMPLGECDVILGTQWLRTLGTILWDFFELWMQFSFNGKKHTWKGLQPGSLSIICSHHMGNILHKNSHDDIAQLHFIQMQPSVVSTTPLDLEEILDRYACVIRGNLRSKMGLLRKIIK